MHWTLAVGEVLVGADAELALITELAAQLPTFDFTDAVGTRIPKDRPGEFVRVIVTGGVERDLVTDQPSITVEYFAVRESRAERGAAYSLGLLQAAGRAGVLGGAVCYGVAAFGLPVNLPHPQVPDRYRYQFTVSVDLRKSPV